MCRESQLELDDAHERRRARGGAEACRGEPLMVSVLDLGEQIGPRLALVAAARTQRARALVDVQHLALGRDEATRLPLGDEQHAHVHEGGKVAHGLPRRERLAERREAVCEASHRRWACCVGKRDLARGG